MKADWLLDIRHAARLLANAPAATLVAVVTLGLGIGANTAVFSAVDSILLRPLPYGNPQQLVAIWNRDTKASGASKLFQGYRDFEEYAAHATSFSAVSTATWAIAPRVWRGHGPTKELFAMPVDASFFSTLRVQAALGRTFLPGDERAGCSIVLSNRFWRTELGTAPDIVGATLDLDRRPCAVRGVMPEDFVFYPAAAQLWILLGPDFLPDRARLSVGVFARLKTGVAIERAQAEVAALHAAVHRQDADARDLAPVVYPLQQEFTWLTSRTLRATLMALGGAVALVLLIACLNVASLLLGRSIGRAHELAVRAAVGASRPRLVRQLLTEGLLLSAIGAGAGLVVAYGAIGYFRHATPIDLPPGAAVSLDWRTLAFTACLAVATALMFGLAPAWRVSAVNPNQALKASGRGVAGARSTHRILRILVLAQVALSVTLLGSAAVLVRSVARMTVEPLGFDPASLFTTRINVPRQRYPDETQLTAFARIVQQRMGALPGVVGAALSSDAIFGRGPAREIAIAGNVSAIPRRASELTVGPEYFRVYGVPLLQGRGFDEHDDAASGPVAIVNAALVRQYFPAASPIGQRIRVGTGANDDGWMVIIGVAGNVKGASLYREMSWADADPIVFRPLAQRPARLLSLAFRTSHELGGIGARVQQEIAALDPEIPVSEIVPADRWIARQLAYPRFRSYVFGAFAVLALLLAAVGLYGVLWQFVTERRQELAVRMALGASRRDVLWLVARHGGLPVVAGLLCGIGLSALAGRSIGAFVYDARSSDAGTIAAVSLTLLMVSAGALALPARRAAHVDPIAALRED